MKYLVFFFVLIGCIAFVPEVLGAKQNLFEGNSSFERLPDTIIPETLYEFELKFQITDSPYWLCGMTPVVDIYPKTDTSNVHINFEKIHTRFYVIGRVPVTLYVDQNISSEKIFLNVSFVSENSSGDEMRSSWSESTVLNISQLSLPAELPSSQDYEFETMTGANCTYDSSVCFGTFHNGTTIPIQCDYRHSCGVISFDKETYKLEEKPPLKQFKHGIPINEIQCRNSLQIMLMHDGSPACVKPESIDKLKQRGFSYVPIGASFHIEKDCNNIDGRAEAQCFKEAFDTCTFAQANSVIHTIEGDAMYLESIIKADCKIHTTFDNTGDRFWGPTAGITTDICNNVELEEKHVWIIDECASEPEFQINYMGQDWELDKKCRDLSGTWNNTFHNCVDLPNLDVCEENGGNLTCMSYEQMGHGRDVCRNVCNFDANEVDRK